MLSPSAAAELVTTPRRFTALSKMTHRMVVDREPEPAVIEAKLFDCRKWRQREPRARWRATSSKSSPFSGARACHMAWRRAGGQRLERARLGERIELIDAQLGPTERSLMSRKASLSRARVMRCGHLLSHPFDQSKTESQRLRASRALSAGGWLGMEFDRQSHELLSMSGGNTQTSCFCASRTMLDAE